MCVCVCLCNVYVVCVCVCVCVFVRVCTRIVEILSLLHIHLYIHTCTEELDGIREALQNQRTLKKLKGSKVDKFSYDSDLQLKISSLTAGEESCLHDFFVVLAICNTVVVSKRSKGKRDSIPVTELPYNMEKLSETVLSQIEQLLGHTNINDIDYEAESPDEQALVEVT